MSALVAGNPAYQEVKLITVDWDMHRDDAIVSELDIPRRSTLVMFRDGKEVARVVAGTAEAAIAEMVDAAVSG